MILLQSSPDGSLKPAEKLCSPIFDARYGKGPFAPCKDIGDQGILSMYGTCLEDACATPDLICSVLAYFAGFCQLSLPGK